MRGGRHFFAKINNMKFIVAYSVENDIQSHRDSAWRLAFLSHGREDLQNKIINKYSDENFRKKIKLARTKKEAEIVINDYLSSMPEYIKNILPVIASGVENILNKKQQEIIDLLEKIYQKKFPFTKIGVFITASFMCSYSYDEKWFRTGWRQTEEKHINTVRHELNHFMFYHYYLSKLVKLGVNKEKREILKEALAIFSNPEGNDKPAVKELEKFLLTIKNQSMDNIIKAAISSGVL